MIRGLEKNNEGERLTQQEATNNGDQWRMQDLAKGEGGHKRGSGGFAPSHLRIFTRKTLI